MSRASFFDAIDKRKTKNKLNIILHNYQGFSTGYRFWSNPYIIFLRKVVLFATLIFTNKFILTELLFNSI